MNTIDKNTYQAAVLLINTVNQAVEYANSAQIRNAIDDLFASGSEHKKALADIFLRNINQVRELRDTGIVRHNTSCVFLDTILKEMIRNEDEKNHLDNGD